MQGGEWNYEMAATQIGNFDSLFTNDFLAPSSSANSFTCICVAPMGSDGLFDLVQLVQWLTTPLVRCVVCRGSLRRSLLG